MVRRSDRLVYVELPMMDTILPSNRWTEAGLVVADGWLVNICVHNGELKIVIMDEEKRAVLEDRISNPHYPHEVCLAFRRSDDG